MKFTNHRQAAAWMIRLGRALQRSNVPISPYISREDNNSNFETARELIAIGKRIGEKYGEETREMKLRAKLQAILKENQKLRTLLNEPLDP